MFLWVPSASATSNFGDLVSNIAVGDGNGGASTHFSHDGQTAYVLNYSSNSVSIINTQTFTTRTINLPGSPDQGFELTNDEQFFYFSDSAGSNVYKINVNSGAVVDTITIGNGFNPEGIISTDDGRYLWVNNWSDASVARINTLDNSVISIPIGEASYSFLISDDRQYLYAIGWGSGLVSKINVSTRQVHTIALNVNCRAFATCPATIVGDKIWVAHAGGIAIVDQSSETITSQITPSVTLNAGFMATSYDGDKVFLADIDTPGVIHVFDVATRSASQITNLANQGTFGVSVSPDGSTLWTTYANSASLVSVNYVGTQKPIINVWGNHNANNSPQIQIQAPDPIQSSTIDTETIFLNTSDTGFMTIFLKGSFKEKIQNIAVNGLNLAQNDWNQTPTSLTIKTLAGDKRNLYIQIFNGSSPLLPIFNVDLSQTSANSESTKQNAIPAVTTFSETSTAQTPSPAKAQPATPTPNTGKAPAKVVSIRCARGKNVKTVKAAKPVCPTGYVKK